VTIFATAAQDDGECHDGGFLGLPGLLEPERVALLLRTRQAGEARRRGRQNATAEPATRETLAALREELNALVRGWHHRSGQPHAAIHAELRRTCGGPPLPQATSAQIRARIETIRRWAARGR